MTAAPGDADRMTQPRSAGPLPATLTALAVALAGCTGDPVRQVGRQGRARREPTAQRRGAALTGRAPTRSGSATPPRPHPHHRAAAPTGRPARTETEPSHEPRDDTRWTGESFRYR